MAVESTDCQFFCLVGFAIKKSRFPEIFKFFGQSSSALAPFEPIIPFLGSPYDINTNVWIMITSRLKLQVI